MTIGIESVCTHAQLTDEIGGTEQMDMILAQSKNSDSVADRTAALRVVLKLLARRTPPIYDLDLVDVTELRDAVAYCAAERLYSQASSSADSVFEKRRQRFETMFSDEMSALMPTVGNDERGPAMSITTERG